MHTSFTSLSEFLHMGRNGSYVWSAYAIVFVVLLLFWIFARRNS
ncbi:MAG: heme exporter protein CcmD [Gammaproteobacteria bacterium RIFCSPHIGHO2_12_FULL_40_19]|nr:MAG: heme exporter protein CcmD [Gammaproteobacteria bacterium RIFCSPHIGHO2_12_FULL_40_19]